VVWTHIDNGKLANQIVRLVAFVVGIFRLCKKSTPEIPQPNTMAFVVQMIALHLCILTKSAVRFKPFLFRELSFAAPKILTNAHFPLILLPCKGVLACNLDLVNQLIRNLEMH